jgi:hypothetical protein
MNLVWDATSDSEQDMEIEIERQGASTFSGRQPVDHRDGVGSIKGGALPLRSAEDREHGEERPVCRTGGASSTDLLVFAKQATAFATSSLY